MIKRKKWGDCGDKKRRERKAGHRDREMADWRKKHKESTLLDDEKICGWWRRGWGVEGRGKGKNKWEGERKGERGKGKGVNSYRRIR